MSIGINLNKCFGNCKKCSHFYMSDYSCLAEDDSCFTQIKSKDALKIVRANKIRKDKLEHLHKMFPELKAQLEEEKLTKKEIDKLMKDLSDNAQDPLLESDKAIIELYKDNCKLKEGITDLLDYLEMVGLTGKSYSKALKLLNELNGEDK